LGVVFGDIGTRPLYTMKECRDHLPAGVEMVPGVLGILSLMFWALVLVVCVKYLLFVTKADNEGEGGIFALLALGPGSRARSGRPWDRVFPDYANSRDGIRRRSRLRRRSRATTAAKKRNRPPAISLPSG
jgi:hypothetical protein